MNGEKLGPNDNRFLLELASDTKIADKNFKNFLSTVDTSGDLMLQYQNHLQSTSTVISKFGATLKTVVSNMSIVAGVTLAIKGAAWAFDQVVHRQENLNNKATESVEAYKSLQGEVNNLNQELKTTTSQMQELSKKPGLTFVEQDDLERLKSSNEELERSIKLRELDAKIAADTARDDVIESLNNTSAYISYVGWENADTTNSQDELEKMSQSNSSKGTILENVEKQLADYDRYVAQKEALEKRLNEIQIAHPEDYIYNLDYNNMDAATVTLQGWIDKIEAELNASSKEINQFKQSLDPAQDSDLINSINKFQEE